jgi:hypothetical protein
MPAAGNYRGKVVYHYAFDIAYEMGREPIKSLLGQPVEQFSIDSSRRNPRQMFFYRPQMVRLPAVERQGPRGPVQVETTVKILPIGALSFSVSVPFAVDSIEELVVYHDLRCNDLPIYEDVRRLAEQAKNELRRHLIRPPEKIGEEEAYTVFCIEGPLIGPGGNKIRAEAWLDQYRREVAALLTQEENPEALSDQEMSESTGRSFSYYESDLMVIDWDAALMIDEPQDFHEALYIVEIANLQLAELEAYDQLLDQALDRSYADLRVQRWRARPETLRDLKEIRVDLARFSDELSNITKFFGDWHLARIYEGVASRFHLGDWHRTIDEKLATLDNLYAMLAHDQNNRWMLLLEVTIVLLFIIDLIILFAGAK